jgi:hypothetical protein
MIEWENQPSRMAAAHFDDVQAHAVIGSGHGNS